jgi:hypothetical protein
MTMKAIKATLPAANTENGKWQDNSNRREQISAYTVVAYKRGQFETPITVRCWMGKSASASTVYATIWTHNRENNGRYFAGAGNAGGYGYHKESAAIGDAIRSAGIKLDTDINGVGDSAIDAALHAIAKALGYRKVTIVKA